MFLVKCLQNKVEDNNFNLFDLTNLLSLYSGKLVINYSRTSAYRHFHFNRIVLLYNTIHPVINLSDSYNTIKCKIIAFLWSYYTSNFDPHDTCTFHLVCPCNSCHTSGYYI